MLGWDQLNILVEEGKVISAASKKFMQKGIKNIVESNIEVEGIMNVEIFSLNYNQISFYYCILSKDFQTPG